MGNHLTTNLKACPDFKRQKLIKEAMSTTNINYHNANRQVSKIPCADIALNNHTNQHSIEIHSNTSQPSTTQQHPSQTTNIGSNPNVNNPKKNPCYRLFTTTIQIEHIIQIKDTGQVVQNLVQSI